jgi:hypothetical protein
VIAREVLEEASPGIGAILEAAIHLLERRIAARNRVKGGKPAANGG